VHRHRRRLNNLIKKGEKEVMRTMLTAAGALLLAACAEDAPQNAVAAAPAKLAPGQYEVVTTVSNFRSTDGKTPIIAAKQGDRITSQACVGADGTPPPELFAAKGDACTVQNPYIRNGRMDLTLDCTRQGASGKIMSQVNGQFTAEGITGTVDTNTALSGDGDYQMRADIAGRRVGECTAAPEAAA
jgi:hypothetical protein